MDGSLDTKRGNTLAGFAETVSTYIEHVNKVNTNIPLNVLNREMAFVMHTMGVRQTFLPSTMLFKIYQANNRLMPFYEYYFNFYKANKRLVVLDVLSKIRVYNPKLFRLFAK